MSTTVSRRWTIPRVIGWAFSVLVSVFIALAVGAMAPQMAPIKQGTAEELWEQAFHFEEKGVALLGHGHVFKDRQGWFLYDKRHWHGSDLYRVPEAEVQASMPELLEKLRAEKENVNIHEYARAGFEKWSNGSEMAAQDAEALIADIREAYLQSKRNEPEIYSMVEFESFLTNVRWARSKWYWASIAFEWSFLSGLMLFAIWPVLKGKGWTRWAAHLGMLPLLFMLPVYLGYARNSFTSAGPSGGVIYPWLLEICHGGTCNELDKQILVYMPQLLEPLSSPVGMPLVLSGRGMPGPTTMIAVGVSIAVIVFVIYKLLQAFDQRISVKRAQVANPVDWLEEIGHESDA